MSATGLQRRYDEPAGKRLLRFAGRHERLWTLVWVIGSALLVAALLIWGVVFDGAEWAVARWEARWDARMARGEELVAAGRWEEAEAFLEELDAAHPALFAKHRLDRQRERILELLSRAQMAQGRSSRAVRTLQRLADFDPRNFHNHFLLAQAAAAADDADLALSEYGAALAIAPTYLPAVQGRIALHLDASRYDRAVAAYEAYQQAWLLGRVTLTCGNTSATFELPVDGRVHALEAPFELAPGWSGPIEIRTAGYSFRIGQLEFEPPARAGESELRAPVRIAQQNWTCENADARTGNAFSARGPGSLARCAATSLDAGAGRVRLELTLYKALPEALWTDIRQSYRNLLQYAELAEAERTGLPGGCLEAGSLFED